jgi:hypothetical protein
MYGNGSNKRHLVYKAACFLFFTCSMALRLFVDIFGAGSMREMMRIGYE